MKISGQDFINLPLRVGNKITYLITYLYDIIHSNTKLISIGAVCRYSSKNNTDMYQSFIIDFLDIELSVLCWLSISTVLNCVFFSK